MLPPSADPDWPDWNREGGVKRENYSNEKKGSIPESEGFVAYLGNIPENARVSNILGSIKQLIGPFKTCNLIKIFGGTCKVVFESKEARDKLLENDLEIYRAPIKTSLTALPLQERSSSLYIAGLQQAGVKQVLGAIKAVVGDFTAVNKLEVVNGCSKVTFKDPDKVEELLVKGLTVSSVPALLSRQPMRSPHQRSQMMGMGMKRGYGQYAGDHPSSSQFIKRSRTNGGWEGGYSGFSEPHPERPFNHVPGPDQMDQSTIEDIQLENKRLKLRVQYLEQQVLMLEETLAKRRKPPSY